jgi:hypothetical protein
MGSLSQWLEQLIGGRSSAKLSQYTEQMRNSGNAQDQFGQGVTNQGLGQLNDLAGQYQNEINQGGLSTDLLRQFGIAQGAISDQQVRGNRDFAAQLSQNFSRSGGQLSPSAMNEFGLENQQNNQESAFTATNALNMGKAQMAMTNTNALFGRLQDVANSITGVGQNQQQLAFNKQMGALQMLYSRNKGIADTIAKTTGGIKMGGT